MDTLKKLIHWKPSFSYDFSVSCPYIWLGWILITFDCYGTNHSLREIKLTDINISLMPD